MTDATDKQLDVLEWMRTYQREHQMPPTLREICDEFRWSSTNAAHECLRSLVRKGLVEHRPNIARGYVARQPEVG